MSAWQHLISMSDESLVQEHMLKHTIYEILNGESILPELNDEPNYYRK